MNLATNSALFAGIGALLASLIPSSASAYASAPLTFCNQASGRALVATGYFTPGASDPADHSVLTGPFVSTGWTNVATGTCFTFPNPFNARYVFWFAATQEYNIDYFQVLAMRNNNATDNFCVTNYFNDGSNGKIPDFTFEDENAARDACSPPSTNPTNRQLWVNTKKVDTWVNATVNFTGK